MPINLVSVISQFLTPEVIATIARTLGLDTSVIGKAAVAAVPALLGSLSGAASSQEGSGKLFETVTSQRPVTPDGLANALAGPGKEALIQNGSSLLSSLLGGSALTALAGAIGKYAGLGQGTGASLVGLLAPLVLGALGKQTAEARLDASGLSQLLASQKDNIAAALPPGMADSLRMAGIPGFSGLSSGPQTTRAAPSNVVTPPTRTRTPLQSASMWIIPLLAVAAAVLWFMGRNVDMADHTKTVNSQNLSVGGVDVGSTLQSTLGSVRTTLDGVTDMGSAEAAMPKLKDANAQLDKIGGMSNQLPANSRTTLASLVTAGRPAIDAALNRILAIPGVATIAKPMADELRNRLDVLTKV
jgi:hypothetical protein